MLMKKFIWVILTDKNQRDCRSPCNKAKKGEMGDKRTKSSFLKLSRMKIVIQ
jgi:hypothetical protein